ncbi:MAG: hypothetical protein Q8O98_02165 [bacterium]|nr:hypothetical protein [bacterium]
MANLEDAKRKQREAQEELGQAILNIVNDFARTMGLPLRDYKILDPDVENEIKGVG